MSSTTTPSTKKDDLTTLPDELLLPVFRSNIPAPTASRCTIKSYIATGVNHRTREIALDAFERDFTPEIVLDIHCHGGRSRWHNPFLLSAGVEDSPLAKYVRGVVVRVRCLHSGFGREVVDEIMRLLRELWEKMPQLGQVELDFLSDEKKFDRKVVKSVELTVERDLPHLKITTTVREDSKVSATDRFKAVVAAFTWRAGTEGWRRLEQYYKVQYDDTENSSEDGD